MEIVEIGVNEITPYENNPRINDKAVKGVANSIREFGFRSPIILDKNHVVICGHTRLKAAKKLGLEKVPCIVANDLTDEQVKALRLADNKVAEKAEWDEDALMEELDEILNIDMGDFGFSMVELEKELGEKYTGRIDRVQYDITGPKPGVDDCTDVFKYHALLGEIEASNVPEVEKQFLKLLAARFIVFRFNRIAEYYAHSDEEMQWLMKMCMAVQVDYNDAIQNGVTAMKEELQEIADKGL